MAARIESRTAQAFQEGMDTPARPDVEVHGLPVLTQAASGTLDQVDITARDTPAAKGLTAHFSGKSVTFRPDDDARDTSSNAAT